jgi:hypothetical protein
MLQRHHKYFINGSRMINGEEDKKEKLMILASSTEFLAPDLFLLMFVQFILVFFSLFPCDAASLQNHNPSQGCLA